MGNLLLFVAGWMVLSVVAWAGAGLAERWLGDRLSPAVRKWGWFFLVLRMCVPLGVGLSLGPLVVSDPVPSAGGLLRVTLPVEATVALTAPSAPLPVLVLPVSVAPRDEGPPTAMVSLLPIGLGLVWFFGLAFLIARGLIARRRLHRLLLSAREPSARVSSLVEAVKARLGVKAGPVPLVLEGLGSPVLVGLVRPRLILPPEDQYTDSELTWMADHELRHWTAGDLWLVGGAQVLTTVFWFLPGLWLLAPRLVSALEADCDRRVLQNRGAEGLRSYSLTLCKVLDAGRGGPQLGMAMAPGARQLRDRFRALGRPVRRSAPALVLAATLVLVTGVWGAEPIPHSPETLPSRFKKAFPLPVDSVGALTTAFGPACHPFNGEWYLHQGVDLAAGSGTPVMALWSGTVVREDFEADGLGYVLELDHGDGVVTRYAHLREAGKPVGTRVGPGQVIARVGATGLATGPHLHFGVMHNGQPLDPAPYLDFPAGYPVLATDLEVGSAAVASSLGPGSPLAPEVRFWVTLRFGPVLHPFTQKPFFHPGLDLAYRAGTPVRAPWAGTVKEVGNNPEVEGFFLWLDHGNGWVSLLSHFEALPKLRVGDPVVAGALVGRLGSSGQSTGPHLHWEVSRNGMPVDPSLFLLSPQTE